MEVTNLRGLFDKKQWEADAAASKVMSPGHCHDLSQSMLALQSGVPGLFPARTMTDLHLETLGVHRAHTPPISISLCRSPSLSRALSPSHSLSQDAEVQACKHNEARL